MTAKERAKDLVCNFWEIQSYEYNYGIDWKMAKQCALVVVDEMTSQMLSLMKVFNEDRSEFEAIELDYLTRVKQEIEKL